MDRAANGTIRAMPRSAAQNRKPPQPSYAATVAKSLTAFANAALLRAGATEIALVPDDRASDHYTKVILYEPARMALLGPNK